MEQIYSSPRFPALLTLRRDPALCSTASSACGRRTRGSGRGARGVSCVGAVAPFSPSARVPFWVVPFKFTKGHGVLVVVTGQLGIASEDMLFRDLACALAILCTALGVGEGLVPGVVALELQLGMARCNALSDLTLLQEQLASRSLP